MPPKIARLIAELGLRFRPSAQADLEAHAAMLALLTRDLADINPEALELATAKWVRESRFMPKASELIDLAHSLGSRHRADIQARIDFGNAHLAQIGRRDCQWVARNGEARIEWR